jgi:Uma2 family endonuclease
MSGPTVRSFMTYEDLCRLPEDDENRYELIDGEVYVIPAPDLSHQEILGRINDAFRAAIRDRSKVYFAPVDVVLADATVLQPDLVFVRQENRGILQAAVRGAPDLVVEVLSRFSATRDRGVKKKTYARHGIAEYWIADPEQPAIEIYRLDAGSATYRLAAHHRPGDRATTPLLPALALDVAALFRDDD